MGQETQNNAQMNGRFVKIDTIERESLIRRILFLPKETLFNLAANPLANTMPAEGVLAALRHYGAQLNDAVDENGVVMPAYQEFDPCTGQCTLLIHYKLDSCEDPPSGQPAWQGFHPDNGSLVYLVHYHKGDIRDPASGEPAWQEFDEQDGRVIRARTYSDAGSRELNTEELKGLNNSRSSRLRPPPTVEPLPPLLSKYTISSARSPYTPSMH